jgi:hypothetical protein
MLLFIGAFAFGQADRATITGTVMDQSGAVVPGVRVVATNAETRATFTASSNDVGIYRLATLPVGNYTMEASHAGFKSYKRGDIALIAEQVLQLDLQLTVGSTVETVTVNGAPPLLGTQSSTVSMTMEQSTIRDLPLNATGGRDALNLMVATVPEIASGASVASSGTQTWLHIAGTEYMTNSIYIDGVEGTAGNQGQVPTPGLDALQEMQVSSTSTAAELGGSGASILYEIKSGTNKFHGSAFEYLQNEALNANTWSNNFFGIKRPTDRFNDYGGSAGGPIWKNHTFIFGDYEWYTQTNMTLNPNGSTVPTPQMLQGNFGQLLTMGKYTGGVTTTPGQAGGAPIMNPCTGLQYQYGQIFDPLTQQVINGATCATPFPGNVIPSNRLSSVSQKVAGVYSKYYAPTIANAITNNFPSMQAGSPISTKRTADLKLDHNFSERNHLSGSYDLVDWYGAGLNGGFNYDVGNGPFGSFFSSTGYNQMYRIVDTYSVSPTLVNTFSVGYSRQPTVQLPPVTSNPSAYGFNVPSVVFPTISYGNTVNGVGYAGTSTAVNAIYTYNAWHLQDTMAWQHGRNSFKFGGTLLTQGLNSEFGGNIQQYNFASDNGGPTNTSLTPWVGSGFATFMLGNVFTADEQISNVSYPRRKTLGFFVVDDLKATSKLTLNLGLRWDLGLPGHDATGRWENFDLNVQNPNWGNYKGAWVFSPSSSTTFETNNDLHQFGPHLGLAYQMKPKLVLRAAYGLYYVPLGDFTTGYGPAFPANQTPLAFGSSNIVNNVEGSTAFNWDSGYPTVYNGQPIPTYYPQNSTATGFGIWNMAMNIDPNILHLGYDQTFYLGGQYEVAKNLMLDVRYEANRGANLHDAGRSMYINDPDISQYQPLLESGNVWTTVNSAASAAAVSAACHCTVPYPYAGFSGPAAAAIAPYPQIDAAGAEVQSFGMPAANDVSAYNAFIIELKARNTHGLYIDYSYVRSKTTGSMVGLNNFGNNWGYPAQNMADLQNSKNWIQGFDQRNLAKGYVTYDLPFGRNRHWLAGASKLDYAVGGWTFGFYGNYGSGMPMGAVHSGFATPYFFGEWNGRANFANGANAHNIQNHFSGKLDLANLADPSNSAFNTGSFTGATAAAPFGDTPYGFDNWRWNSGAASENMSLIKHFSFGQDGRFKASLRFEFYDVFNRHYINAPDDGYITDQYFGQVTGVYGGRTGQAGARFEW